MLRPLAVAALCLTLFSATAPAFACPPGQVPCDRYCCRR